MKHNILKEESHTSRRRNRQAKTGETKKKDKHTLLIGIASGLTIGLVSIAVSFLVIPNLKYISTPEPLSILDLSENSIYTRAKYLIDKKDNLADLREAELLFTELNERHPNNPHIILSLANAYAFQSKFGFKTDITSLLEMYKKAIMLAPQLPEPYYRLAVIQYWGKWDLKNATKHLQKCISIAPSHINCQALYGYFLHIQGKHVKALKQYDIVLSLDANHYGRAGMIWLYTMAKSYDLAERELEKFYAINPANPHYHSKALTFYESTHQDKKAFPHYLNNFVKAGYTERELNEADYAFTSGGLPQLNYWLVNTKKEQKDIGQGLPPISTARYHVAAGEYEKALDYLEQAYKNKLHNKLLWINVDPKYAPLKEHKRFQALLHAYNLIE